MHLKTDENEIEIRKGIYIYIYIYIYPEKRQRIIDELRLV